MGLKIFGIGAAQNTDNAGEIILLDGLDTSRLIGIIDEHGDDSMFKKVGAITYFKKIYSEKDCENEKQARCWQYAKVPFLYIEGELADDTEHPNAKASAEMIKWSQRPDVPLDIGFSVDGGIAERRNSANQVTEDKESGKTLSKTLACDIALTVKRCNPKCKLFLENDLMKSIATAPAPANYKELLAKSMAAHSFNEISLEQVLADKLNKLKKSLDNYFGSFTDLKCHKCSNGVRFFKAGDVPNCCSKCGSSFSMISLWKAMNR